MKRSSGILFHISSLPSPYGIGTFGKAATDFVDFLAEAGQRFWQILPIGPTGYGDSPYQSFSTFAGNPYFIDLDLLAADGLLTPQDYVNLDWGSDPERTDYDKLYRSRFRVLFAAYRHLDENKRASLAAFTRENAHWLEDYALYMALKDSLGGAPWSEWPQELRTRQPAALAHARARLAPEIDFWRFIQHRFTDQWLALKAYANRRGVRIIGDLPIYVAEDSADVWANPSLFELDDDLCPVRVAGCPPDAFSKTGQLWGNPLYRWTDRREAVFAWWVRRMKAAAAWYDVVRIDHFRGFDSYYAIPAKDKTAEHGQWVQGPGYALFEALRAGLGKQGKEIIAEDLGMLTRSVHTLRKKTGYPGMKVLQFAFDAKGDSDYLPHNHEKNCVVYTGTHDNDTVCGWLKTARRADARFCRQYLNLHRNEPVSWGFIRAAWASPGSTAIAPMQDFLSLGREARMNTPSTLGGNWVWRAHPGILTPALARDIYEITTLYGRRADR